MRLLVVYNPNARLAGRCSPQVIEEQLRRHGADVELIVSTDESVAREATRRAVASRSVDRVAVAGGDGTVSAAIDALARTRVPLAVIPLGTGNVLAEEAGIPPGHWRMGCRVAAAGRDVVRIDVGRAGERFFATMFGAGLDAQVVADISQQHKRNYGRWAFVRQLLQTSARFRPRRFTIVADGRQITTDALVAIVSNTARYAWRMHFSPEARPDDGELDLCLLAPASRWRLLIEGAAAFVLQRPALSSPLTARFRRMTVHCEPPAYWQADGELAGRTPVDVEVVPSALSVVLGPRPSALRRLLQAGWNRRRGASGAAEDKLPANRRRQP